MPDFSFAQLAQGADRSGTSGHVYPPGSYDAVVEEATYTHSRDGGKPQWKVMWRTTTGDNAGARALRWYMTVNADNPQSLGIMIRQLEAMGIPESWILSLPGTLDSGVGEQVAQAMRGRQGTIVVIADTYDGMPTHKVRDVRLARPGAPADWPRQQQAQNAMGMAPGAPAGYPQPGAPAGYPQQGAPAGYPGAPQPGYPQPPAAPVYGSQPGPQQGPYGTPPGQQFPGQAFPQQPPAAPPQAPPAPGQAPYSAPAYQAPGYPAQNGAQPPYAPQPQPGQPQGPGDYAQQAQQAQQAVPPVPGPAPQQGYPGAQPAPQGPAPAAPMGAPGQAPGAPPVQFQPPVPPGQPAQPAPGAAPPPPWAS